MTQLTKAEIESARNIAAVLAGHRQDIIARGYRAAVNRLLGNLLVADPEMDLAAAVDHALQFGHRILTEIEQAAVSRELH